MQAKIRLLLEVQSGQALHCLPFCQDLSFTLWYNFYNGVLKRLCTAKFGTFKIKENYDVYFLYMNVSWIKKTYRNDPKFSDG